MSRNIADPQPGFFTMKLVRHGPLVAARIWRPCHCTINAIADGEPHAWRDTCDRFPQLVAEIDGKPADVERVWTGGREIDDPDPELAYWVMVREAEWAKDNAPHEPRANPRQSIDFNSTKPVF